MTLNGYKGTGVSAREGGFTLMEIMVVLIITTVLLTIAIPSYYNSVVKSQRADAKAALMEVAGRMEQRMLDHGSYTYDMTKLGYAADPRVSSDGHYNVDAAACDGGGAATCYVLTATAVSSSRQSDDSDCASFILDSTGARTATGDLASECWK